MTPWSWLAARPAAVRAIGVSAATGIIRSLALPLATWAIYRHPEGTVLAAVSAVYLALVAAGWWLEVRSAMAVEESVGEEIHRLRLSVVERVRTAELRFVEQNRRALDDALGDIEDLKRVTGSLQAYAKAAFELMGYLVYAMATMGLAALALLAGFVWLARGMRRYARAQRAELIGLGERDHALGAALDDLWIGMPRFLLDRRAMDDVRAEVRTRRRALTGQLQRHSDIWTRATAFNTAHPLIVCGVLALLATGPLGLTGDTALAFIALVFLTRGATFALLEVGELVIAERALARLHDLERSLDAAQIDPPVERVPEVDALRLDRLVFRFEDGFDLGPISLAFEPGELVFVVGHNGSGKTTLMKVMSGLYPAQRGTIDLGGRPVRRDRLRAAFTVTFIDAYLFDRAHGLDADDAEIEAALAEVGLADIVGVRDGVFDSLALSTGQRRRLALAVALLEKRPIVVFDEWDAHQDPETKRWYFETLLPRLAQQGRIVVAVCHDDRFFGAADRVIELEGGRLRAVHVRGAGPIEPARS